MAEAGQDRRAMLRIAEVTLILGIVWAVLAFGGTEPAFFAPVQVLYLATAVMLAASPKVVTTTIPRETIVVPAVLVSVVLLQLCPLPSGLLQRFAGRDIPMSDSRLTSLS